MIPETLDRPTEPAVRTAEIVREFGPFPDAAAVHGVTHDGHLVWAATGTRLVVARGLESQLTAERPAHLASIAAVTDEAVFSGIDVDEARRDTVWTEALAAVEIARASVTRLRRTVARYRIRRPAKRRRPRG